MAEQFIVKDSGQRQEFATGMRRDVQHDKPRYDLVYRGPLLERWAWLLKRGADKYGPDNWTKAATQEELDRFIASAARHFAQWMAGDTGEDHAAAVVFNLNGAEYVRGRMKQQQQEQQHERTC